MAERSSLVRLQGEYDVDVDWRGFELSPQTPKGGMSLTAKFGARAAQMTERVKGFAREFGIPDEDFHPPMHSPNTRSALAVAEYARDEGKLTPFRDAAMEAHWKDNVSLEDPDVIRKVAKKAGIDPEKAVVAMSDEQYLGRVDALREEANLAGVSGIPTFFFGGIKVVGCQPYEVLERAASMAGAKKKA
ncbi:MAG: DsbA family protein [Myxococcaceae bacterium]